VIVEFLEGDPDRPVITGSLYNEQQMPHYPLPDEKNKSYFKSNSTLGGEGYNEWMFDDTAGEERVYMHAQKNMDFRVRNDFKSRVYGNYHSIVGWEKDGEKGGDQRELVWEDKHQTIKGSQFEHVHGNLQWMIGNGDADDGGNLDLVVEKKKTELIEGDSDLTVLGNHKEKLDGTVSTTIGGDQHTKVNGNIAVESGAMGEIHVKSGMKLILEAGMQLSLVGPGGFIDIGPAGVTIEGVMVKVNCGGGQPAQGSGVQAEAPEEPERAEPAEPAFAWNSASGMKSAPD
jgi:type VI secretion system secreted protein VgrG